MQSRLAYRPAREQNQTSSNHEVTSGHTGGFNSHKQRAQQYRTPKSPETVNQKFPPTTGQGSGPAVPHSEILTTKQDGTFANLLLPSIPAANQRSNKQIKNQF